MVRMVTNVEIQVAMFSIGDGKASGPNGYTASFLKNAWDVIGIDVSNVVRDFFSNSKLLKELNHTIIALIPKVSVACDKAILYELFDFACGDVNSAIVIMEALDEFNNVLGLVPSIPKSIAFFCNVPHAVKLEILSSMPFKEGNLPAKYRGVSLISSQLLYRDYKELVESFKTLLLIGRTSFCLL
ncbi:hypothetical protein Tco_1087925 [Tanacetum coccineum]